MADPHVATQAGAEPLLLTVREAATILRIGKDLAYDLAREGKLPVLRLGRRIVVPRQALLRWIQTQAANHPRNVSGPSVLSLAEDQEA